MADINELIARMKVTAQEEITCREACDTSDLWQDEASPENVLALTEALENALSRIEKLDARTLSVKLPEYILCQTAPETIWLQTNGDDSAESKWPENSNDVSWCWEKIFDSDTLYVRADLAAGIKLQIEGEE